VNRVQSAPKADLEISIGIEIEIEIDQISCLRGDNAETDTDTAAASMIQTRDGSAPESRDTATASLYAKGNSLQRQLQRQRAAVDRQHALLEAEIRQ